MVMLLQYFIYKLLRWGSCLNSHDVYCADFWKDCKLKHVGKHLIIIGKWWLFMNTLRKQFLKLCNFLCQLIQIDTMHSIEQFLNLFCRRSFLTSTKVLPNLWLRFTLMRQSYLLQILVILEQISLISLQYMVSSLMLGGFYIWWGNKDIRGMYVN
jgi:hypothetical protein